MASPKIAPCSLIRPPIQGDKTIVVLGVFRGGTSCIAESLFQLGVPMGDLDYSTHNDDYDCYEDGVIGSAIDDVIRHNRHRDEWANEWRYVQQVVNDKNALHGVWGFKKPSAVFIIDQLLPLLRNPHIILVFRDPLAIWQGTVARGVEGKWQPWTTSRHHLACIMDLMEKPRGPTLAVSYERAKDDRVGLATAIMKFAGVKGRGVNCYNNKVSVIKDR